MLRLCLLAITWFSVMCYSARILYGGPNDMRWSVYGQASTTEQMFIVQNGVDVAVDQVQNSNIYYCGKDGSGVSSIKFLNIKTANTTQITIDSYAATLLQGWNSLAIDGVHNFLYAKKAESQIVMRYDISSLPTTGVPVCDVGGVIGNGVSPWIVDDAFNIFWFAFDDGVSTNTTSRGIIYRCDMTHGAMCNATSPYSVIVATFHLRTSLRMSWFAIDTRIGFNRLYFATAMTDDTDSQLYSVQYASMNAVLAPLYNETRATANTPAQIVDMFVNIQDRRLYYVCKDCTGGNIASLALANLAASTRTVDSVTGSPSSVDLCSSCGATINPTSRARQAPPDGTWTSPCQWNGDHTRAHEYSLVVETSGGVTNVYTNVTSYLDGSCAAPAFEYRMYLVSQYTTQSGNGDEYLPGFDRLERDGYSMTLTPGASMIGYLNSNCACPTGSVWQTNVARTIDVSSPTCCGNFQRPMMYYQFDEFGSTLLLTRDYPDPLSAYTTFEIDTILLASVGRLVGDECDSSVQCASLTCDTTTATCAASAGGGGGTGDNSSSDQQLCLQDHCLIYWQAYLVIAGVAIVVLSLCGGLIHCCRKRCCGRKDSDELHAYQMEVA